VDDSGRLSVQTFSEVVRDYCVFIEEADTASSRIYVIRCLELLLGLHLQALKLPASAARGESTEGGIDAGQWRAIRDRIASRLDRDSYSMIFEPFDEAPSPLLGSLSDDLSDIWKDLKEGLMQFDIGNEAGVANAVWIWRFSFEYHWGSHHSAHAIGALHALLFGAHAIS
jgi:hypothetical protein